MSDDAKRSSPAPLTDAQKALVRDHLSLSEEIARSMRARMPPHVTFDEMRSDAYAGLLDAARTFDARSAMDFPKYASHRIKGAIRDGGRKRSSYDRGQIEVKKRQSRLDEARAVGAPLSDTLKHAADVLASGYPVHRTAESRLDDVSAGGPSPETAADQALERERLHSAMNKLDTVDREVLQSHFLEDRGLNTTAQALGIRKSWTSRLVHRAVRRLAEILHRSPRR
jgi:RNA polymerase sigma factor for flagellar operon FliA